MENKKKTTAKKKWENVIPTQKKVAKIIYEFKKGELLFGKTNTAVPHPKKAIKIALSEATELKK